MVRGDRECIYARSVRLGRSNVHYAQNYPGFSIEILQIESTSQPETCQLGRERVIRRVRLSLSKAVRVNKDRKNLPSSLSSALAEFPDWRCQLQSGLWLVDSICNISMGFSPAHDSGAGLVLSFRVTFYKCSMPSFGVLIYCLIGFIRGLSKAPASGLPPEKPRNALSSKYDHLGAYLLLRCKDSTAVALDSTLQCSLPCHTSSNSCFDQAPGSPGTGPPPFVCGPCRRPFRS